MYNFNRKHYIFKQSSGKVWNFSCDENQDLCYSSLTKRGSWTESVLIQKNCFPSFYADIDYDDFFHLLFQDKLGNIFYCRFDGTNIKTVPVLNSKTPSSYDKHLFLIPSKNAIHLFYVVEHNNTSILAHQVLNGDSAGKPRVIDYVIKGNRPFTVACDKSGSMYVFYQSSDGRYLQLGFKKFLQSQNFWSEFTPVTRFEGNCECARTAVDSSNVLHICFQRRSGRQYELVYQQKIPDKNLWTKESIIHSSPYPFNDSSILWLADSLVVFWIRDDIIYFSKSENGGSTWSKPSRYNFSAGRQLLCIAYKTNNPNESEKISGDELPGSFINGYKLAFYQELQASAQNLSPDELRNMIVDSLKLIKANIDELKESFSILREDISHLDLTQQSLDRELTKNSVKLDLLENEIKGIKSANMHLESYINSIRFPGSKEPPSNNTRISSIERKKKYALRGNFPKGKYRKR